MKNNELLKKYAGISTRIRRIFAYHYDQIQREVQTEISTLTPELQGQFMDLIIEYMEESYIIARYYGWEPKEEDLEEIISHTSYFNIHVDDAIYEVLTMPREEITI